MNKMTGPNQDKAQRVFEKYPHLFKGIGKMKDVKVKLHINKDLHPVKQLHRRILFHQRKNVKKCLDELIEHH